MLLNFADPRFEHTVTENIKVRDQYPRQSA